MDKSSKIAVIGAGPVGGILAAFLLRAGRDVTVIDVYQPHLEKMRADGIAVEGMHQFVAPLTSAFPGVDDAARAGMRFDCVFVSVKAPVTKKAAIHLPLVLAPDGVAVSFQNGLDSEAPLLELVGPERTLRGVVNYAGNLLDLGRIKMTFFNGCNYLGAAAAGNARAEAQAREVTGLLAGSELATEYSEDVRRHVWEKVLRNAALMPVSALTGMDMAQAMESQSGLFLVERLLTEGMEVAAKVGFPFEKKFYYDTLAYYLKAGHHMPSMWGDIQDGRITEITVLNDRIAEYGEKHGVPVPYNRSLANLVRCIDELAALKKKA